MLFNVNLDGCECVVEASDTIDAIRIARETHPSIDVKEQTAEPYRDMACDPVALLETVGEVPEEKSVAKPSRNKHK